MRHRYARTKLNFNSKILWCTRRCQTICWELLWFFVLFCLYFAYYRSVESLQLTFEQPTIHLKALLRLVLTWCFKTHARSVRHFMFSVTTYISWLVQRLLFRPKLLSHQDLKNQLVKFHIHRAVSICLQILNLNCWPKLKKIKQVQELYWNEKSSCSVEPFLHF